MGAMQDKSMTGIDMTTGKNAISRRDFVAVSIAAGLASQAHPAAAQATVVESAVDVMTPDGVADGYLYYPEGAGSWPAVILYPDALAVRPSFRDMGRRLASSGYVVLVPNFFYRSGRTPVIRPDFDFGNPDHRAELAQLRTPLTPDAVMRDALAYLDFLGAQTQTAPGTKVGVQGYCMTGAFAIRTAAAAPERVAAVASFHGGGLATDQPDSPHLVIGNTQARYLIAIAASDDTNDPNAKNTLRTALEAAGRPHTVEVYEGALHGWCVRDMPLQNGTPIYNEPQAERAWSELLALYDGSLRPA